MMYINISDVTMDVEITRRTHYIYPTSGGAVTYCLANCVKTSRPQQWRPDIPFFGQASHAVLLIFLMDRQQSYRHQPTTIQLASFHFLTSTTGDNFFIAQFVTLIGEHKLWLMLKSNMIQISLLSHVLLDMIW